VTKGPLRCGIRRKAQITQKEKERILIQSPTDHAIRAWRDGGYLLVAELPPEATARREFCGVEQLSDDDVRARIASGWRPITIEDGTDLLFEELEERSALWLREGKDDDGPRIGGFGRNGLAIVLPVGRDARQVLFVAVSEMTDEDVRWELQQGARLVTHDELLALLSEHDADINSAPSPELVVASWRAAMNRIIQQ
jgi:hypothetical protein